MAGTEFLCRNRTVYTDMNIFSYELAKGSVDPSPDLYESKFVVDDNIGESIHIHYRNIRIEMSVEGFDRFGKQVVEAADKYNNGDS